MPPLPACTSSPSAASRPVPCPVPKWPGIAARRDLGMIARSPAAPPTTPSPQSSGTLVSLHLEGGRMNAVLAPYQHAIEALCRQYHVRRLELFGSAATGRFRPNESDIDLLVVFEELPPGTYANSYFGLLHALEDLFGRH